jgi:potassium efflux system protein
MSLSSSLIKGFGVAFYMLWSLLIGQLASAQPLTDQVSDVVASRLKMLDDEAADIAKEQQELASWRIQEPNRSAELLTRRVSEVEVDQAGLAVETAKVTWESIQLDIVASEQHRKELANQIQSLNDKIQQLSSLPETQRDKELINRTKEMLAETQRLLELELRHGEQLTKRERLAQERLVLAQQWRSELREAFTSQQQMVLQESLDELDKKLSAKRSEYQQQVIKYRTRTNQLRQDPNATQAAVDLAEVQLVEADEFIFLLTNQLKLAQIGMQLEKLASLAPGMPSELRILKSKSSELTQLQNQLGTLADLLNSKQALLEQRQEVIDKRSELDTEHQQAYQQAQRILVQVIREFSSQMQRTTKLRETVVARLAVIDAAYLKQKQQGLTARHQLPTSISEWQALVSELMTVPATFLQLARNIVLSLKAAVEQANAATWSILILLEVLWIGVCLGLGRLTRVKHIESAQTFTQKAILVATDLLRTDRYDLMLGGVIIIAAWLLDIVPPGLAVIGVLVGVWLGLRITIKLSHWILNSAIGFPQRQPGLNRLIVVYALLVATFGLVLLIAHLELLSLPLREMLDRIFMLLLLPPVYLALRIRTLLMEMLQEKKQGVYWVRLLGLVSFAVPLAIVTAAILGIAGFLNLAWYVAGYLGIVLGILIGWLIVRGTVIDLAQYIQLKLERRSTRSTFWIKSFVDPVHFLIRVLLFLTMVWIIYRLFVEDPTTGFDLQAWLQRPLFSLGETSVNPLNLFGSLLLLVMVFYIGRWAREVSYSWFYGNIRDLGMRNSLSVFTQYAVVVIGLLIALNIIGINLTSLTVFAGALGVGIGFGLQNIANNFISGLILLAERPLRTKDWVTIGDKEGVVSQIGMRSVTLTTWDNQDVIIPNSNLTSTAFINWTRTNNIVRTVLLIGVHYKDDPHQAQAIIEEAVTMQPEVLLDPPPRIWLHEFAASAVNFKVYYHIDVQQFSRLDVKSKVLFAIWDALKEAGIAIPYPQQDIYIRELPEADDRWISSSPDAMALAKNT